MSSNFLEKFSSFVRLLSFSFFLSVLSRALRLLFVSSQMRLPKATDAGLRDRTLNLWFADGSKALRGYEAGSRLYSVEQNFKLKIGVRIVDFANCRFSVQ